MTQFNNGWWNCFVSFAIELLLYRKQNANNDQYIVSVLKEAGVRKDEISEYLLLNNYIPDNVRVWLENYVNDSYE